MFIYVDSHDILLPYLNKKNTDMPGHLYNQSSLIVVVCQYYICCVMRKPVFASAKTKAMISCIVTLELICGFVFTPSS